jgi:hypothetical protein
LHPFAWVQSVILKTIKCGSAVSEENAGFPMLREEAEMCIHAERQCEKQRKMQK